MRRAAMLCICIGLGGPAFTPAHADDNPPALPLEQQPAIPLQHQGQERKPPPWQVHAESSASDLARAADALEAHTDRLTRIDRVAKTRGDASRRLRAYFDGEDLLLLVDEIHQGDYGVSDRRYFFDGDWLYHHRAAGRQLAADNSGLVRIEKRLYLSPQGKALYAFQSLAGTPVTVTAGEVREILAEAQRLRQQFR